jgi:hypothetical protein
MIGRSIPAGATVIVVLGLVVAEVATAQPVYSEVTGSWYELVHGPAITRWDAHDAAMAKTHNGMGGHLAVITSQAENDFLTDTFLHSPVDYRYWLGSNQPAYSSEPDGNWQWVTGEPWAYDSWYTGQPNNNAGPAEDSMEIFANPDGDPHRGKWNDLVADYEWNNGYIVEYETIPAQNPVYWPVTGNWYELVEPGAPISWTNAQSAAALRTHNGVSGRLATITFPAENQFVANTFLTSASQPSYCIGGQQPPGSPEPDGNWRWVTQEPWGYANWDSGEPSNLFGNKPEGRLATYSAASTFPVGTWNDVPEWYSHSGYLVEYGDGPAFQTTMTIEIQAFIDGTDYLVIKGDTLQWHHTEHVAVGRHGWGNGDEPTIITTFRDGSLEMDNVEWIPTWPEDPPAPFMYEAWSSIFEGLSTPLPETDMMVVGLTAVDARERLTLEQYPTAENDYTLIVKFSDNLGFGPTWYWARISVGVIPEPATLSLLAVGGLLLIRRRGA